MVDHLVGFLLYCLETLVRFSENLSNTTNFAKQRQPFNFFEILSNKSKSTYVPYISKQSKCLLIERFYDRITIIAECYNWTENSAESA